MIDKGDAPPTDHRAVQRERRPTPGVSVVTVPPDAPPNTQFSSPAALRSSRICGAIASIPVILTSPPISAAMSIEIDSPSACSIGPASDHAAFDRVTGPVLTPSCGQIDGRTDPKITNCRPVRLLNLPTAMPAIFSAGIRNNAPTDSRTRISIAPITRTIHRMATP